MMPHRQPSWHNKSLMTNRRCQIVLATTGKLRRVENARTLLPAAVAYLCRYMKSKAFASLSIVFGILLAGVASPWHATAQQKGTLAPNESPAPTGTYAPPPPMRRNLFGLLQTNGVPAFTLRLETNGTYVAEASKPRYSQGIDGTGLFSYPDIARGTWRWDAQTREFLLEPGQFTFYIKRLPVDKGNPDRLVWGTGFLERHENQ